MVDSRGSTPSREEPTSYPDRARQEKSKSMGMYTEFCFNAALKQDVPSKVLAILDAMGTSGKFIVNPPDHGLFNTNNRHQSMFIMDSAYFPHRTTFALFSEYCTWFLNIHCNFKNYDNEISLFLDWIFPYLEECGDKLLGYYRYEAKKIPTLIYYSDLQK